MRALYESADLGEIPVRNPQQSAEQILIEKDNFFIKKGTV